MYRFNGSFHDRIGHKLCALAEFYNVSKRAIVAIAIERYYDDLAKVDGADLEAIRKAIVENES